MFSHFRPALTLTVLFTALLGILYPLTVTGIAQALLPSQANGSLVQKGDKVVGSALIGQTFTADRYFHGRPSATSATDPNDASKTIDAPYNASNSGGSNKGPLSQGLIDRVKGDLEALKAETGAALAPADAVTTSASGLDPHVSPAFARLQAARVAKARHWPQSRVEDILNARIEDRLGLFGEPRVNVLLLNLALDEGK